jgi:hypothetical protein
MKWHIISASPMVLLMKSSKTDMSFLKVCARWVPKQLTGEHKCKCLIACPGLLNCYHEEGHAFEAHYHWGWDILSIVEDPSDGDFLYHHDSALCHEARSVREWFVGSTVSEMDCPAQSPDLNPTEYLLDELGRQLCFRPQCPTVLTALATALQEKWAAMPPETFRHQVESLPGKSSSCQRQKVGPSGINVHDWEVYHRRSRITVSSRCPDIFDQIV